MSDAGDQPSWTIYGPPALNRRCGGCTACCHQLPTKFDNGTVKPANTRCPWQLSTGCKHYDKRPFSCKTWSCGWLMQVDAAGLKRPDKGGYIIDSALDTVLANGKPFEVIQVWIDETRPNAHEAVELRAYLAAMAVKHGMPALIRFNSQDGFMLLAPCLTDSPEWVAIDSNLGIPDTPGSSAMVSREELNRRIRASGANPMQATARYR